MKSLFKIALRNVLLHWRKSLAAIISLAAGLVSIVLFQGYMDDVQRMYIETFRSRMMYGDVIIEHKELRNPEGRAEPWKFAVTPEDQKFIDEFLNSYSDKLIASSRFLQISGVVTNGRTSPIFRGYGYDVKNGEAIRYPDWSWNTLYGQPLDPNNPYGAVIGQSLGKYLGCAPVRKEKIMDAVAGYKPEDRPFECDTKSIQLNITTPEGQLNAIDVEIGGMIDVLYKDIDDKFVAIPLPAAQELMNTQTVSYYTAKLKDLSNLPDFLNDFNQRAEKANLGYRMVRWQDHIIGDMYKRTMSLLGVFRNFVMTIIIAIATLSIFNTMMKIVKERTREIGTLQSLGFVRTKIVFIFVVEAVILSVLGGAIGSVIAAIATIGVNSIGLVYKAGILVEPVPLRILINPNLYGISFVLLSCIASVTAWGVCRSAVKRTASENLSFT
jgi:putative ABC transport system permease protein